MSNIWFTADLHLGHTNIIKHCKRPFQTTDEMNETIIANWNSLVQPDDKVYILGDFSMTSNGEVLYGWFSRLKGSKALITGNHDSNECARLPWSFVNHVLMLKQGDLRIWLSHYAHRTWPGSYHGSFHLYGHSHGTLPDFKRSMDIGVDVWGFKPVSLDQVVERLSTQEVAP